MRKQAVLEPGQEDQREFEALRRVQRHQLHAVVPLLGLALAGLQRRMREERATAAMLRRPLGLETARGADQFVQVLEPRLGLLAFVLLVVVDEPAAPGSRGPPARAARARGIARRALDELQEACIASRARGRSSVDAADRCAACHSEIALPARGRGSRPANVAPMPRVGTLTTRSKDCIVVAVRDQPQVGKRILDFGALEEPQAAVDAVGEAVPQQELFEHPRLGVGAVKDRHFAARRRPARDPVLDPVRPRTPPRRVRCSRGRAGSVRRRSPRSRASLPRRPVLCPMIAFAALRMVPVER